MRKLFWNYARVIDQSEKIISKFTKAFKFIRQTFSV